MTIPVALLLLTSLFTSESDAAFKSEDQWFQFGESSYRLLNNEGEGYHERVVCEIECLNMGGNLTSVHSNEENIFLTHLITDQQDWNYWSTWIGGDHMEENQGEFRWSDGSSWDFEAWNENQEDQGFGCVMMGLHSNPGTWAVDYCEHSIYTKNCICKKELM